MMWSFSAHASFRKCPRQWFYKKSYASSRANDPLRREAQRLSKLEGLRAWRGKIVDTIISETIIPSLRWNAPCGIDQAKKKADQLFVQQRAQRMQEMGKRLFFEIEYGLPLTEEYSQMLARRSTPHSIISIKQTRMGTTKTGKDSRTSASAKFQTWRGQCPGGP